MRDHFRQLRSSQLDRALTPLRSANIPRPPKGWIRAIREALGVSSGDLAERMRTNRSLVVQHGVPYIRFGFTPLEADAICAWGESSRAQFQRWGIPSERIRCA